MVELLSMEVNMQQDATGYKSIKVPTWVYENGKRAEAELIRRGLNPLPRESLEPSTCPVCGTSLETFEVKYQYAKCPYCGYRQQTFGIATNAATIGVAIGLGAILGLALAALFRELSSSRDRR